MFWKYFWTLFFLIFGQRHGVIIPVLTNQIMADKRREIYFLFCLFWRHVSSWRRPSKQWTSALRPVNKGRNKFCLCLLVGVHFQLRPVNKSFEADSPGNSFFEKSLLSCWNSVNQIYILNQDENLLLVIYHIHVVFQDIELSSLIAQCKYPPNIALILR